MPDRDELLKALREAHEACLNAMQILAEQEPMKPAKVQSGNRTDCFCRNCTTKVGMLFSNEDAWRFHYNFCPYCGEEVQWDDDKRNSK